ncbi:MAG: hypothetical protein PHF18_10725 [Methanosarcina sp.]|uniref:hypothetical protein n=1 Tax=Methanosarcina sp. TaxID=2213 RepID=UPI00263585A7|nr:hypothetical protein [Methanosarcina sp.]MDD3247301.1 hypothetical protein [Methanosarcina sp.]
MIDITKRTIKPFPPVFPPVTIKPILSVSSITPQKKQKYTVEIYFLEGIQFGIPFITEYLIGASKESYIYY